MAAANETSNSEKSYISYIIIPMEFSTRTWTESGVYLRDDSLDPDTRHKIVSRESPRVPNWNSIMMPTVTLKEKIISKLPRMSHVWFT